MTPAAGGVSHLNLRLSKENGIIMVMVKDMKVGKM